jgi:hypothetical protein
MDDPRGADAIHDDGSIPKRPTGSTRISVQRMLADAREKVKHPPPKPFPWFWVTIGITLLSAGGYGTQLLRRWRRNRYRVQPSAVVKMIEEGKAPLLMDTRAADSYEALPLRIPSSVHLTAEELASGAAASNWTSTAPWWRTAPRPMKPPAPG